MDFGTKLGVEKSFKQKHFHQEGEATSCLVKTSARQFSNGRQTLGVSIKKKRDMWGRLYLRIVLLSLPPYKKRWRQRFNHVCRLSLFPTKRREDNRTFRVVLWAVHECTSPPCVFTSPGGVLALSCLILGLMAVCVFFLLCNRIVGFLG